MVCEGGCRIQVWMSLGIMSYLIMFVSVLFLSVQYNVHIGCERSVDDIWFFCFFWLYNSYESILTEEARGRLCFLPCCQLLLLGAIRRFYRPVWIWTLPRTAVHG